MMLAASIQCNELEWSAVSKIASLLSATPMSAYPQPASFISPVSNGDTERGDAALAVWYCTCALSKDLISERTLAFYCAYLRLEATVVPQ